ncbi:hypothetical protein RRG08_039428 [Elysia crispata]|uniref:Uncharacterized protein n=1 Tax=Elysia crispata TaxID=231223 RepID=A0AAE1DVN6_9GAST|nr:hypothetical protein RRG08_039428 [Elysia crispata]
MNQQIDCAIQSCSTCQKHVSQSKETLMCHSVPDNPFDKIGADLFSFGNQDLSADGGLHYQKTKNSVTHGVQQDRSPNVSDTRPPAETSFVLQQPHQRSETAATTPVRYRNQRPWEPAQVLQRLGARSYLIKTKNGTYRRNRRDLRETTETFDLSRPDPFEFDVQLPQSATPSTTYATPSTQTESQNSSDQQAETKWQSCETSSKTNTVEKAEPIS